MTPSSALTLHFRLGVAAPVVQVALPVVRLHDAAQLAVQRRVETLVRREYHDPPRVLPPPDAVAAHHDLKDQYFFQDQDI